MQKKIRYIIKKYAIKYAIEKKVDVIKVDICSKCHPYFTGKQKLVDTGGRVDKFNKRYGIWWRYLAW